MLLRTIIPTSSLTVARAEGCHVYDESDRAYYDFTSGIGVLNLGHSHPTIVEAVQRQAAAVMHAQFTTVASSQLNRFAAEVTRWIPTSLTDVFPTNSGSEAIDSSVRMARQITGRSVVISFDGAFHGRTVAAASVSAYSSKIKHGFHPMMAGVVHSSYPGVNGRSVEEAIDQLEFLLDAQVSPEDVAAILIEPIQGENAYRKADPEFMVYLRTLADRIGAKLIVDEVQSGYGRSGTFWAFEQSDIVPDMIVAGKAAGGGLPFGYVALKGEDAECLLPGSFGGTFGGNPMAMAAALATFEVFTSEDPMQASIDNAAWVTSALSQIKSESRYVKEVRQHGYMIALDLVDDQGKPDAASVNRVLKAAEDRGLLLIKGGRNGTSIRVLPPLNTPKGDLIAGLELLRQAVRSLSTSTTA